MVFDIRLLGNVIISTMAAGIFYYYYSRFLGPRYTKKWIYILAFIGYLMVNIYFSVNFNPPYIFLSNIIVHIFLLLPLYSGTVFHRIFASVLLFSYALLTEGLAMATVMWLTDHVFPLTPARDLMYFITAFIAHIFILGIVILVVKYRKAPLSSATVSYRVSLMALVLICVILINIQISIMLQIANEISFTTVLSIICIFIISVFSLILFEKVLYYMQKEQEAKLFEQQVDQDAKLFAYIDENREEIRSIKHDLINHLTGIHHMAKEEQYQALQDYIEEYMKEVMPAAAETFTGLPSIDAIISVKKSHVSRIKIPFTVNIKSFKAERLLINPVHINIILSNALDNAIEACESLNENMERFINLGLDMDGYIFSMYLQNSSLPVSDFNTEQLPRTKKKDSSKHGHGLPNIRRITEQYEGMFEIDYEPGTINELGIIYKPGVFKLKVILQNTC